MNNKIQDLTDRLSKALDQNYDVVNMDAVLSVITALEGTTITKEQLVATRLAKFINHLRRRTKSEHLARRAKALLKRWREMVGMQQPQESSMNTISIAANIASDNAMGGNLQHHQQLQLRSQPTSPIAAINSEGANAKAYAVDYLRSTVSNPAPTISSSLTRSANLNVHSNKRLENAAERQQGVIASATVSPMHSNGKQQQPISFANCITGLSQNNSGITNARKNFPTITQHLILPARGGRKPIIMGPTPTYVIDQSSNSNSDISYISSSNIKPQQPTITEPIVIDIQDSNSDSDVIATTTEINTKSALPVAETVTDAASTPYFSKTKKPKKEKKRKGEPQEQQSYSQSQMIVIDDVAVSNQQQQPPEKFIPLPAEKSLVPYPSCNMSEILSLSNSSMSSMFPGELTKNAREQQKSSAATASSNRSDLTFAGKFKQSSTMTPGFNTDNVLGFNGGNNVVRHIVISPTNTSLTTKPSETPTVKFTPCENIGGNSNDSTSNSRISPFQVIEMPSQRGQQPQKTSASVPQSQLLPPNILPSSSASTFLPQQTFDVMTTSTSTVTPTAIAPAEKKIPKKRGRKKGSKGVDSVIAKETSLSTQMLITSLGSGNKKVKTTKELYAEMQNRKLGASAHAAVAAAVTSPPKSLALKSISTVQQQTTLSRPASSCSEPSSLHSPRTLDAYPTTATISTFATRSTPDNYLINAHAEADSCSGDTITTDQSRDSNITAAQRGLYLESNSNTQAAPAVLKGNETKNLALIERNAIEMKLRELLQKLPPVPSAAEIEAACVSEWPCTCQIVEILPQKLQNTQQTDKNDSANDVDNSGKVGSQVQQSLNATGAAAENEINKSTALQPAVPEKPKKSIFDLDFDDDDDPLHTLKAEVHAASLSKKLNAPESDELAGSVTEKPSEGVSELQAAEEVIEEATSAVQPKPVLPTYQIIEDPNCAAKQHFEIRTQKITKFHVDALHNCYIANVNGNWDDNADAAAQNGQAINSTSTDDKIGYNVVPKYGCFSNDRLPKDLTHVSFTKNYKPKPAVISAMEAYYKRPFIGVSNRFLQRKSKRRHKPHCRKVKAQRETKSEEVKVEQNVPEVLVVPDGMETESKSYNECELMETVDDVVESCLLNDIIDVAEAAETNNNSKIVLKSIEIDIANGANNETILSDGVDSNNFLLAIADRLNYAKKLPENGDNSNHVMDADCDVILSSACSNELATHNEQDSITVVAAAMSSSNEQQQAAKLDDSTSSRRSSSCSNTSLKQTQQSINLKLRRQRLLQQQQQQQKDQSKSNKRKQKKSSSVPRRIKRIKIAINGDVATQRRISVGTNSSSTDEYDNEDVEYHEDHGDDERNNDEQDTEDGEQNDDDDNNCADDDSAESTFEIVNDDADDSMADYEPETAEDDEEDDEYDDDEEYTGDFHEVVTRDLSTHATGNNHIVLTIKKTPSKTNSPSNSLSAMSPLNAANPVAASQLHGSTSSNNVNINTADKPSNIDDDLKRKQQQPQEVAATASESLISESDEATTVPPTAVTETATATLPEADTVLPTKPMRICFTHKRRRLRLRRKVKAQKTLKFLDTPANSLSQSSTTKEPAKKLHHQLFLPQELYMRSTNGARTRILSPSSCDSSCAEQSEYEYSSFSEDDALIKDEMKPSLTEKVLGVKRKSAVAVTDVCNSSSCSCSEDDEDANTEKQTANGLKTACNDDDEQLDKVKDEAMLSAEKEEQQHDEEQELPDGNNGLLPSFNNIYYEQKADDDDDDVDRANVEMTTTETSPPKQQQQLSVNDMAELKQQLPNEKCDDFIINNSLGNNNFNLTNYVECRPSLASNAVNNDDDSNCRRPNIKVHVDNNSDDVERPPPVTQQQTQPRKECRTGLRAVDEDVHDEQGNNCARMQQFKEWHQVLQLRSNEDQLLAVLPYVLLD